MNQRKSHRTFVSYIDKSRVYYQAQGYERPYEWAHFDDVALTPLPKPLAQCRIGVVTTADKGGALAPRTAKLFRASNREAANLQAEKAWDREATHLDDPETYLPLTRLEEWVSRKRIGSLNDHFYGVPTDYSQRRTIGEDAPQIEAWARQDGVDAVVLVPI